MSAIFYRLHGEPSEKYYAFKTFRDTTPDKRKLSSIAKDLAEKLELSERTIREWARQWNWEERARAWDVQLDEEFIKSIGKYQRDTLEEEREMLHEWGAHLQEMIQLVPTLIADKEQQVEDPETPGVMVTIVDRAINTQETAQLGRAINQFLVMKRRAALLPGATSTKYLEDATINLSGNRRVVTIERVTMEDSGGFESQVGRVEVKEVEAKQLRDGNEYEPRY